MQNVYRCAAGVMLSVLCFSSGPQSAVGQVAADPAVMLCASVGTNPPAIMLTWKASTYGTQYVVYRKSVPSFTWGTALTNIPISATQFVDGAVSAGVGYEYRVDRIGGAVAGYGYLCSGIDVPAVEVRGKVVLLVDNSFSTALSNELARFEQDLAGDGWTVLRHDVARGDTPPNIKTIVEADYLADSVNVKALLLFGHIPVARSGFIYPDGHPNHQGAWPADVYYADMDGSWTDVGTYTNAYGSNIPGDGKFDQSSMPSSVELAVGRVDMWNLPSFPKNEQELLRQYLNKNHAYRHRITAVLAQGVIDDHFGYHDGEAFAANGWRNFVPMFGLPATNTVFAGAWTTQPDTAYLWGYGCGGGSYTTVGGVVTTPQMTTSDPAVFTMLFGSYLGDWGSADNVMRGALATPSNGLTCAWAGRPNWFLHPMAMGATIGDCARLTQNNPAYYNGVDPFYMPDNYGGRYVHVALLGDPTLRLRMPAPPTSLSATSSSIGMSLNWTPATAPVLGYDVFRSINAAGPYARVLEGVAADVSSVLDPDPMAGPCVYKVSARERTLSASGTYFNNSQAVFAQAIGQGVVPSAPTGLQASDGAFTDRVRLTWIPSSAATRGYEVWRATTNAPALAVRIGILAGTLYDDLAVPEETPYYYWVTACNGAGTGAKSGSDAGFKGLAPAAPLCEISASDGTRTNAIRITWQPLTNEVATYEVWRGDTPDPAGAQQLATALIASPYDDSTVTSLTNVYYYWVRTVKGSGASPLGASDAGFMGLPAPGGLDASDALFTDRVHLEWLPLGGADSYEVWRAFGSGTTNWTRLAEVQTTTFEDRSAVGGYRWIYSISARNRLGSSALGNVDSGCLGVQAPANLFAGDGSSTSEVTVSWSPFMGSATHEIWRNTTTVLSGATVIGQTPDWKFADTGAVVGVTYYYWARRIDGVSTSAFSAVDSGFVAASAPGAPPAAVSGVTASDGIATNQLVVTWQPVAGAACYEIWAGTGTNSLYSSIMGITSETNVTFGADYSLLYFFWIRARNAAGLGAFGDMDSGYVQPQAPSGVLASEGLAGGISVSWTPDYRMAGYEVWRSPDGLSSNAARVARLGYATSWFDASALAGTVYTYWVKGTNSYATSDFSAGDSGYGSVAEAPGSVVASDGVFTGLVLVSWTAVTLADQYEVWRSASTNIAAATVVGLVTTNVFDDTTAVPGLVYWYWAKSIAAGTTGCLGAADSGFAACVVAPPRSVTAADGTSPAGIALYWQPSDVLATGYEVWRGTNGDPQAATCVAQLGLVTNHYDLTATADAFYNYWVRGTNAAGPGGWSKPDIGWRLLPAPASVSASSGTSTGSVTLAWSAVTGATGYEIWRSTFSSFSNASMIAESVTTGYADTSAVAGLTWYYHVRARNAISPGAFSGLASGWVCSSSVQDAPAWVQASDGLYSGRVEVAWASVPGGTSYEVWAGVSNEMTTATHLTDTVTTNYSHAVLDDAVRYYWVRAVNAAGPGYYGPVAAGGAALTVPVSLMAQETTPTSVLLSWTDRSAGEAGFEIQYGISGPAVTWLATVATNVTAYAHTGLVAGTTYRYRVRAIRGSVASAWTAEAEATPQCHNTTNAVPWAESFENYAVAQSVSGSNGWYSRNGGEGWVTDTPAVIAAQTNGYTGSFPLATTHRRVLAFSGELANRVAGPENGDIWVDLMLTANHVDELPTEVTNTQVAVNVGTNGLLCLLHADLTAGSNVWTQLQHAPLATGSWFRLTMHLAYGAVNTNNASVRFAQVYLNGQVLESPQAYAYNDGQGQSGGTWFALGRRNVRALSAVRLINQAMSGYVDDVVVATNTPFVAATTTNGTPLWWLAQYGVTNEFDAAAARDDDHDGMTAAQEYLAGTAPNDPASVLTIRAIMNAQGSNGLMWITASNWVGTPFRVERSTNLAGKAWVVVDPEVGRTPPTNTWWESPPPGNTPIFYRISVSNSPAWQ